MIAIRPFYTVKELADVLDLNERTVRRWMKRAHICSDINGLAIRRIALSELQAKVPMVWESLLAAAQAQAFVPRMAA